MADFSRKISTRNMYVCLQPVKSVEDRGQQWKFPPFWLKLITKWISKEREHKVYGFIKQCKPNIIKHINSARFKSVISTAETSKAFSVTFKAVWMVSSTWKGPVQECCLQCFQGLHLLRNLGENTQNFSMAPPLAGSYAQCIFFNSQKLTNLLDFFIGESAAIITTNFCQNSPHGKHFCFC